VQRGQEKVDLTQFEESYDSQQGYASKINVLAPPDLVAL